MFQTLRQGNTVYVLDQTDGVVFKSGTISEIKPTYTGGMDMRVKTDDLEYVFLQVPYGQSIAKYGAATVSESIDSIVTEVNKIREKSEKAITEAEINRHKKQLKDCDAILRKLNPSYEKEQRRDEEIEMLKNQMNSMSQSLANIEKLLANNKKIE